MFVNKAIYFKGKKFIPTSEVSKLTGIGDYIGQLCRAKVSSKLMEEVGMCENEILSIKNTRRAPKV